MGTVLKNVVRFVNLAIGVPTAQVHELNVNGVPVAPRLVLQGGLNGTLGGFDVAADNQELVVTRLPTSSGPDVDIYVEYWHTIEAVIPVPGDLAGLTPFIAGNGGGGGGGNSCADLNYELVVPSVAGQQFYTLPLGNFVADLPGQSTLEVDKGAGFVSIAFPTGYIHFRRSRPGTPVSVSDAAIGFAVVAPVLSGWTFRFRWKEPCIPVAPIAIAKVVLPEDFTFEWNANSSTPPNGVRIPSLANVQVEFWRQSHASGGRSGVSGGPPYRIRMGRRYLPYYRGALNVFAFPVDEFRRGISKQRNRFKVAYYDPLTGARSALSTDTIVVCASDKDDAANNRTPVRTAASVWIE